MDTDFIDMLMEHIRCAFEAIQAGQDYTAQTVQPGQVVVVRRSPRALRSMGSHEYQAILAYWPDWSVSTPIKNGSTLVGTVTVTCRDGKMLQAFQSCALRNYYGLAPSPLANSITVLPFEVGGLK